MSQISTLSSSPGTRAWTVGSVLLLVLLGFETPARSQAIPEISHNPLDCIGVGQYPVVDAAIRPGQSICTAKVYFRSDKYPRFYWVEMVVHDGKYIGILPKPGPKTARVIYYIEAVDVTFNDAVDVEHDPEVRDKCSERLAYLPGDEPGIIVGATETGAPVTACFQIWRLGQCEYEFDGSCSHSSSGPIIEYSWQIDKTSELGGQIDRVGPSSSTTVSWGSCSGQSIEVLLDVKDASNNCAVTNSGYVINQRTLETQIVCETSFTSFLGVPPCDGTARGQVLLKPRSG